MSLDSHEKDNHDNMITINCIKRKIDNLTYLFKNGKFSLLINLFVSFMVTLEFSNGTEKMDIQFVMEEFMSRLNKLDSYYLEFAYSVDKSDKSEKFDCKQNKSDSKDDKKEFDKEFDIFRNKIYKLFDLEDILKLILTKCVVFGKNIPTDYIRPYTKLLIDGLLFTDTEEEFDDKLIEYIADRKGNVKEYLKELIDKMDKTDKKG